MLDTALGVLSATVALATLIWPQWIEAVFGLDPDASSGALEWAMVAVAVASAAACTRAALAHRTR